MIYKNTILLTIFMIISQGLGILRERLFANYMGVGLELDMYNAAFRVPDLMLGVMMSFVVSSTVLPFLYKYEEESSKSCESYISSLFAFFSMIMIIMSLVLYPLMPYLLGFILKGFDQESIMTTAHYSRLLLIQPLLLGLSYLISSIAQSKNRFTLYGVGPVMYSLSIITVFYLYYDKLGAVSAIYGAMLGALLQLAVQVIILYKEKVSINFKNFNTSYIREQVSISVPRSGSHIVSQVKIIYVTYLASIIGVGAISVLALAQKIYDVFLQLIAHNLSVSSMPTMSSYYAKGDVIGYKKIFKNIYVLILSVSVLVSVLAYNFSMDLLRIIYGDIASLEVINFVFGIFVLVLPISALNYYMSLVSASRKDTKRPLLSNLLSLAVLIFSGQYFYGAGYGLTGLLYASILSYVVSFVMLNYFSFKK